MTRPGRPENPLKTEGGPRAELASELRRMRELAGLTYKNLSGETQRAPSTLTAAVDGKQLPSWQVVRAWTQACGGDIDNVRNLYERACTEAGRPAPGPDLSGGKPPDPATARTAREFLAQMTRLQIWAGNPSLRMLNRRSGGRLPPSTISEARRRDSLPRRDLVLDYVRACYHARVGHVPDNALRDWERSWNVIKSHEKHLAAANGQARRRRPRLASSAAPVLSAIGVVLIVVIALLVSHGISRPGAADGGSNYNLPGASMPQICTKAGPVVFAVSGRQNSPAPVLTGSMQSAAVTAIQQGSPIGMVNLDGQPRLIMAGAFSDAGANAVALQNDERNYLAEVAAAVENTRATYPDADVLEALNVSGAAIRSACPSGGTIYLEDSGLQDTGPVNFRQPGMLSATPSDIVTFLASEHDLPNLNGMTVVLIGLGDTAPPQPELTIDQRANVIDIWTAIAKAGGATSVQVNPAPLTEPAPAHVPAVSLVPVPLEQEWNSSDPSYVFPDSSPVGFEPNTAVFRDPAAASAALAGLAKYLTANPSARIELTGTTAHEGSLIACIALARQRANAVKAVLMQLGAQPSQIATRGLGWRFPGYINDQGPDGSLLPGPAEQNRSVIVTKI